MKLTLHAKLTPRQIAEAFAELDDEGMADVFIQVAEIAKGWDLRGQMQWLMVGRHLKTCSCSTYEAKAMLCEIAEGIAD